jgi:hypothetical protein
MDILEVGWSTWKNLVDNQALSLAHVWMGGAGTEANHGHIYVYAGNTIRVFNYIIQKDSAEETEWMSIYQGSSAQAIGTDDALGIILGASAPIFDLDAGIRRHDDGSLVTKNDPGTEDTDPKYHAFHLTASAAGDNTFDLMNSPNFYVQGFQFQIENPKFGDTVEVQFRSDGSIPTFFGPEDTLIQSFGKMNPPLATYANGWTPRVEEPDDKIGTAKLVPAGLKVTLIYSSTDASTRRIAIDLVTQE